MKKNSWIGLNFFSPSSPLLGIDGVDEMVKVSVNSSFDVDFDKIQKKKIAIHHVHSLNFYLMILNFFLTLELKLEMVVVVEVGIDFHSNQN